ncbi:MAG: NADH-quinone oxidoreductase subunit C [Candidatus Berkiellales bacterium]
MSKLAALAEQLQATFKEELKSLQVANDQITMTIPGSHVISVCQRLKTDSAFRFEMLMDLCALDYLHYGCSEWETSAASTKGFERAVQPISESNPNSTWKNPRFAVVYHLLSITHNHRVRVKAFVPDNTLIIDSVIDIWNSANWYEREAFDLFGILFAGHPDLRRLLTDYGFIGHPFRKDFPLVGNVEVRYDAKQKRVIYEPVDIVPRTLVPKVIRKNVANESDVGGAHE